MESMLEVDGDTEEHLGGNIQQELNGIYIFP
jgi:hypothetical protein